MSDTPRKRGRPSHWTAPPDRDPGLALREIRPMRRWEYATLSSERPLTVDQLNVFGADGWELVDVYVRMDAVHAVFKREVQ